MRGVDNSENDQRVGYYYAALTMVISGFAIFLNGKGVKLFADSTLYTTLKNAVVGVALLCPLLVVARHRAAWRGITLKQWGLLVSLAAIGGSIPYVLFFRGLQLTTPVTGSLLNHSQFLLVALLALVVLGERRGALMWGALIVLLAGTNLGLNINVLVWNEGAVLIALSTLLFAFGVVLSKYLLADLPALTVMTAKMSIGSAMLLCYLAVTGRIGGMTHLSGTQWQYVLATGIVLLAFTVTAFQALRRLPATSATAIPAAAPVITTFLVCLDARRITLSLADGLGLLLMASAAATIYYVGKRNARGAQPSGKLIPA